MYKVYMHTCPNGKVYIGITNMNLSDRWKNGGKGYKKQYFYKAIVKYGWDSISHEVLLDGLTKEQAERAEVELITKYQSNDPQFGYNIDNGGKGGARMSESTKEKLRQINRGKQPSEETCRKISEANRGRKHTEEAKRKISESNMGKHMSAEARRKLSESRRGLKLSEEVKARMRENRKDITSPRSTSVCLMDNDGKIIKEYSTLKQASIDLKVSRNSIAWVCQGKQRQTKGLMFAYANNLEKRETSAMNINDIQILPKRGKKEITYNSETHCMTEWARIVGINENTLRARLRRGRTFEEAISTP